MVETRLVTLIDQDLVAIINSPNENVLERFWFISFENSYHYSVVDWREMSLWYQMLSVWFGTQQPLPRFLDFQLKMKSVISIQKFSYLKTHLRNLLRVLGLYKKELKRYLENK